MAAGFVSEGGAVHIKWFVFEVARNLYCSASEVFGTLEQFGVGCLHILLDLENRGRIILSLTGSHVCRPILCAMSDTSKTSFLKMKMPLMIKPFRLWETMMVIIWSLCHGGKRKDYPTALLNFSFGFIF